MFSDESMPVVTCPSAWRIEVQTKDQETETPVITRYQRGLQTTRRKEAECQTDSFMYVQEELAVDSSEVAEDVLQSLRRLEPLMCRELERAARSTAFDGFFGGSGGRGGRHGVDADTGASSVRLSVLASGGSPDLDGLPVLAVSWSATGAFVAAALGRLDHQDWCLHRAAVCVWNAASARVAAAAAGQDQQQQQQKPHTVLDVSSCVLSVQYHPSNPSLLAGGSFTGELLVWNVAASQEGEQLLASSLSLLSAGGSGGPELVHREPIVEILWVRKSGASSRDHLLTVGADGLLLLWQLDSRKATLALGAAYRLAAKSLPKSLRVRASGRGAGVGVTCARFLGDGDSTSSATSTATATLAVGCDCGAVLLCRVKTRASKSFDPAAVAATAQLPDPTVRAIDCASIGVVLGLDSVSLSSATFPMFLACGVSGACALHRASAAATGAASAGGAGAPPALLCLETASGVAHACSASVARPGLVAVATERSGVLVYSLLAAAGATGPPLAALTVASASTASDQQQQQQQQAVGCVQWNPVNHSWLAAGLPDGRLVVWQLAEAASGGGGSAGVAEFLAGLGGGVGSGVGGGGGDVGGGGGESGQQVD